MTPLHSTTRRSAACAVLCLLLTAPIGALAAETGAGEPEPGAAGWEILEERPAQGEQCIVCRQLIHDGEIVEVRYKGRVVHVKAEMLPEFEADPDGYFATMQARAALFDEAAMETPPMRKGWLGLGFYVLVGLVCGAACSYIALDRGLDARTWFTAGFLANVLALAVLVSRRSTRDAGAAAPGLAKIPTTHAPRSCPSCGATQHPAATRCDSCDRTLEPTVEPETARA